MRMTESKITALVGLALIFTLPLLAQKTGPDSCEKACGIPNLTSEQTAKIETLKIEHQKALLPLQTDLKSKRLQLRLRRVKRPRDGKDGRLQARFQGN